MAGIVAHKFSSAIADGGDATLVRPSDWNDFHQFATGTAGQVLVRDTGDADGAVFGVAGVVGGGTGIASYAVGDLIYASAATTLAKLADVAAGSYLRSGGVTTAPVWSTVTLPNSAVVGDLLSVSATNVYANIAAVALGQVLASQGTGTLPAWTASPRLSAILDANGNPLQAFTATASAVYGLTLANAALLGTVAIGVTAVTQAASAVAGTPLSITAQVAVAGSSNAGAAAGGSITITTGAAARLTSGNANGGNIVLATGAGIGTGVAGQILIPDGVATAPAIGFTSSISGGLAQFGLYRSTTNRIGIAASGNSTPNTQLGGGTVSLISTGAFQFSNSTTDATTTIDTILTRGGAAATWQLGAADVNGSAVAQTLQVQSAITGTDQNGANWTFKGSKQTGAGTPGDIIFQTSVKLSTGATQGTPVTGLTITGAIASMQPSVVVGNQALATNATEGFLYIPTCAGTPTGVPTTRTGRIAMIYDTTNHQFWFYDGGWLQPKTPAAAAIVTWQ